MNDIATLVDAENEHLIAALDDLDHAQWSAPSLCAGWSICDVVIHLLMPYELSFPRFLLKMAAARFDFDRLAHRWATEDARSPAEASSALRATAQQRFGVPGAPPEAPLSHLVIHAEDIYRPLGIATRPQRCQRRHRPRPTDRPTVPQVSPRRAPQRTRIHRHRHRLDPR